MARQRRSHQSTLPASVACSIAGTQRGTGHPKMTETIGQSMLAVLTALLAALHPWAAAGASFGCVFYLMAPAVMEGWRKAGYTVASWGLGYAAGIMAYGGGPPYEEGAMLVSGVSSAVIVMILTAFVGAGEKGGPLPPLLADILDRIPFTRRKGPHDGT